MKPLSCPWCSSTKARPVVVGSGGAFVGSVVCDCGASGPVCRSLDPSDVEERVVRRWNEAHGGYQLPEQGWGF